ncbi:S-adenosylmethionine:tRNA ribosyltransferase-isomerase [hydrothermal vent metagenome]|uniref:S-adenosylmethionine:tRNA ribosyltransferase-isomerase n=1 Tax=hydrothermal vent metagenome TaxID=652676 RepID=A0A1W1CQF8_9ZZZZ
MNLSDFDFNLPEELIAQTPLKNRSDSKLLVFDNDITDTNFSNITQFINKNDLLILNDTKVIPARIFAKKTTGGKLEIMIERIVDNNNIIAMIKASKPLKSDDLILFENGVKWQVINKDNSMYHLKSLNDIDVFDFLDNFGHIPLPPYIKREDNKNDKNRYQTVFAKNLGAVAAPTAGLHFNSELLEKFKHQFITLHVGAGTFQPVRSENIKEHKMHYEHYHIPQKTIDAIKKTKENGGRIIAVGTTSMRALESAYALKEIKRENETNIFIYPGFEFKVVDLLITNFHLPKSSLLMLVSAFIGLENMHKIYQHAIKNNYRFFSYGDVMLLKKSLA